MGALPYFFRHSGEACTGLEPGAGILQIFHVNVMGFLILEKLWIK
jgi:hypothetical protein